MKKKMTVAVGALALAACSVTPDGVYRVEWGETVPNLEHGDRLDIVFDNSVSENWGSDATVEWATEECEDIGGEPHWYNDGDYRLVCEAVDF